MFERRPVWGVLIGLTICISIWRISVQEPSLLAAEFGGGYSNVGSNAGGGGNGLPQIAYYHQQQLQQQQHQKQQQQLYGGKHLLARKPNDGSEQTNESPTDPDTERGPETNTNRVHTNSLAGRRLKPRVTSSSSPDQEVGQRGAVVGRKANNTKDNTKIYDNYKTKMSINRSQTEETHSPLGKSGAWMLPGLDRHGIVRDGNASSPRLNTANSTTTASLEPPALGSALNRGQATTSSNTGRMATSQAYEVLRELPHNDSHHLIDLHNFEYIMSQPECSDDIAALILVHSAPANFKKRLLLRETWGSRDQLEGSGVRLIFLLGAVANRTLQHKLQRENILFGDMVQGNFVDDYKNMTYKHVMAFKWFLYNCGHAHILVKVDDDVYVNTPQLLKYIEESAGESSGPPGVVPLPPSSGDSSEHNPRTYYYTGIKVPNASNSQVRPSSAASVQRPFEPAQQLFHHPQNLLFCQKQVGSRVKRSYRSKWHVSVQEYAGRYYPPYCPGYSIIYSPDVVWRLYNAAQNHKYFWIDDVHVTGTLAQLSNITITSSLPYVLSSDMCERVLAGKTDLDELEFVFSCPELTEQQIRDLWHLSLLQHAASSKKPKISSNPGQRERKTTDQEEEEYPVVADQQYLYDGFR